MVAVDKEETEIVQTPPHNMVVLHVLETSHLNKIVTHMNVQVCLCYKTSLDRVLFIVCLLPQFHMNTQLGSMLTNSLFVS